MTTRMMVRTRRPLGLMSSAAGVALGLILSGATPAAATPTIVLDEPTGDVRVDALTFVAVHYSSDGPPIDPATLTVSLDGEVWTDKPDRCVVNQGDATCVIAAEDHLVAGPLEIVASIADTSGALVSVTRSITVFPYFTASAPAAGTNGDTLTIVARGLDPTPASNALRFAATSPNGTVDVPLGTVNIGDGTATLQVPAMGVASGPLSLLVGGTAAGETQPFTLSHPLPACGIFRRWRYLADGSAFVWYQELKNPAPAGCPALPIDGDPDVKRYVAHVSGSGQVTVLLPIIRIFEHDYTDIHSWAVAKDGQTFAVAYTSKINGAWTEKLLIGSGPSASISDVTYPGPYVRPSAMDFDAAGDLIFADWAADGVLRLVRIPNAIQGGPVSAVFGPALQQQTAGVEPLSWVHTVNVPCDGDVVLGLTYDSSTGASAFRMRRVAVDTGATLAESIAFDGGNNALGRDGLMTCHTDELWVNSDAYTEEKAVLHRFHLGRYPRTIDGHVEAAVLSTRFGQNGMAVRPNGQVEMVASEYPWPTPVVVAQSGICPAEGGCGACLVEQDEPDPRRELFGEPKPADPIPSTALHLCPERALEILQRTTRWKPQRDLVKNIDVFVKSKQPLIALPTLEIRGPDNVVLTNQSVTVSQVGSNPLIYKMTWSGPWSFQSGPLTTYLKSGDYTLTVRGNTTGGAGVTSAPNDPNRIVSLVEVTGVTLERVSTLAPPVDDNPAVPAFNGQCPSPVPAAGAQVDCVVDHPAVGKRIFAEETSWTPSSTIYDRVKVVAAVHPYVPSPNSAGPVMVHFKSMDVDDFGRNRPEDLDDDGDPLKHLAVWDNRGSPHGGSLWVPESRPINAYALAETYLQVSQQPGDNYRVAASTSLAFLDDLAAWQPSDTGEIRHKSNQLPLSTAEQEERVLSPVLTVWRTLHVELDSMGAPPTERDSLDLSRDAQRNFLDGTVDGIAGGVYVPPPAEPLYPRDITLGVDQTPAALPLADGSISPGRFENASLCLGPQPHAEQIGCGGSVVLQVSSNSLNFVRQDAGFRIPFELTLGASSLTGYVLTYDKLNGAFELDRAVTGSGHENAVLEVAGAVFDVVYANDRTVVVAPGDSLPFILVDDDATPVPVSSIAEIYMVGDTNRWAQAYVRVQYDLPTAGRTAPFARNVDRSIEAALPQLLLGLDETTVDRPSFWISYLQIGFQGEAILLGSDGSVDPFGGDNDPGAEGTVAGITAWPGGVPSRMSLLFQESVSDGGVESTCGADLAMAKTTLHEVGHQFGLNHPDVEGLAAHSAHPIGGVMAHGCPVTDSGVIVHFFRARHLHQIRGRQ